MDSQLRNIMVIMVVALVVVGSIAYFLWSQDNGPGKLDQFAQCLSSSGVKFYGAFWCSHCQNQKALFGNSKKYLPYIECSTPDSNGQLQVCKDEQITTYPTWRFPDGTSQEGELTLQQLAEKSFCPLPN